MRIRTVKPEFFLHEKLFLLEQESGLPVRLAFIGLWCASDREGRFKWEPKKLGVQILPYDSVDFSRVLHALTTRGFVVKYASGTGEFGVIPSFKRHQIVNNRESASELPAPPVDLEQQAIDACLTREPRVPDGNAGLQSGREQEQEQEHSTPPTPQGGSGEGGLNGKAVRKPSGRKTRTATDKKMERIDPPAVMQRLGSWFGRKPSTPCSVEEWEAYQKVRPGDDEMDLIEDYYLAVIPSETDYRRRNLITLLHNWTGECDRAAAWQLEAKR